MPNYNIVAQMIESTVVAEYEPAPRRAEAYQSEAELEREFMHLLSEQGYEDKPIHSENELVDNLREKNPEADVSYNLDNPTRIVQVQHPN